MGRILLSSSAIYLVPVWITLLGALLVLARPKRGLAPPADFEQRFSWKWLHPSPLELRPLMRRSACKPGFARNILTAYCNELSQFSERIQRIRL
jgi:hypothetical protein